MESLNAYENYIIRLANTQVIVDPNSSLLRNLSSIIMRDVMDNNRLAWDLLAESGSPDGISDKTFENAASYLIMKYEQR